MRRRRSRPIEVLAAGPATRPRSAPLRPTTTKKRIGAGWRTLMARED